MNTPHEPSAEEKQYPLKWGALEAKARGPIISQFGHTLQNAMGASAHAIFQACALAKGNLNQDFVPDYSGTEPWFSPMPNPSWSKIVSFDPHGHTTASDFPELVSQGLAKPTINITNAHLFLPEIKEDIDAGILQADQKVLLNNEGELSVALGHIEPVWYLPGVAERLHTEVSGLREQLRNTGMFADLMKENDMDVLVMPIPGTTLLIIGDPTKVGNPSVEHAVRVHDACHDSDVFSNDKCTCRPYLMFAIRECIRTAQNGGVGIIVYVKHTEGRGMGEANKIGIYNKRARNPKGDTSSQYYAVAEAVCGSKDMRPFSLVLDVLLWLGVKKIHKILSGSWDKFNGLMTGPDGIQILGNVPLPESLVHEEAMIEFKAKDASGYTLSDAKPDLDDFSHIKGRSLPPLT